MIRLGIMQRWRAVLATVALAALTLVGPLAAGGRLAVARTQRLFVLTGSATTVLDITHL